MSDDLEPVDGGVAEPPTSGTSPRWGRLAAPLWLCGAIGVVASFLGFGIGKTSSGGDASVPLFRCSDGVLGLISADGLLDFEVVGIEAPLRAGSGAGMDDDLLPVQGSMTTELAGTPAGSQGFRPTDGTVAVTLELPRAAVGRSAVIVGENSKVIARPTIRAPFCK